MENVSLILLYVYVKIVLWEVNAGQICLAKHNFVKPA